MQKFSMKLIFGSRFVACLIVLTMISNWRIIDLIFQPACTVVWWDVFMTVIALLFFVLNLLAVIGLCLIKKWGFIMSYVAIAFSTVMLSTIYLPMILEILPDNLHVVALLLVNLLIILMLIYLQRLLKSHKS